MTIYTDITPQVNWSLDCEIDDCDGYGCEIHDDLIFGACEVSGCSSPVSSHLVEVNGNASPMCQWHFN
jgi:hypothetical protein